jgi:hypothetical protein
MKIAFCTTCKGRTGHLERTLPKNLADNADYADAVFIVLDYNSSDHLLGYLRLNHQESIESGRLQVYSYGGDHAFRMAHAKNMAHRLGMMAGADVLVNMDADNFTGPGFATYIAEQFEQQPDIFLWARMIQEGVDRTARGISGRIAVSARGFQNAGGYDERFETWSPDDKDFNTRLRRLGFEGREIERRFIRAILHTDKMRFREYKHAVEQVEEYHIDKVNDCDTTVVNFGNIGCGSVRDLRTGLQVDLLPFPTRIFGIGMHKTATTSLHLALDVLGINSAHWKNAHWAKAIWDEMHTWGTSLTLEKHYALSDLPITTLYEKLDKGYPGSKFILTVRNENRWLESVKNHWSPEHNQFRAAWSTDSFTHKIHKAIYGQKHFDAEIFLARYRRHNAEVREYFKHRPDDLLVMDMDSNPGWLDLCNFLDKPIPDCVYPTAFITPKKEKDLFASGSGI